MCWRCELVRTTADALARRPAGVCLQAARRPSYGFRSKNYSFAAPKAQFHGTSFAAKKKTSTQSGPHGTPGEDLFQLDALRQSIADIQFKLGENITKMRSTVRVNADNFEAIRVLIDKNSKTSVPLRDVAQVVPKGGRSITVQVLDAAVSFSATPPCQG
jgi:hypothetical protein